MWRELTYYAIGDTCTHRGGLLSEGDVQGTKVTCPWHGADFDLKSGAVLGPPARTKIFPLRFLLPELHPDLRKEAGSTKISFYEKNKTPKGSSAARDDDRNDVFLV